VYIYDLKEMKCLYTLKQPVTKIEYEEGRKGGINYFFPHIELVGCYLLTNSYRGVELLVYDLTDGKYLYNLNNPLVEHTFLKKYESSITDIKITNDYSRIIVSGTQYTNK
jgi:hypothetical protein